MNFPVLAANIKADNVRGIAKSTVVKVYFKYVYTYHWLNSLATYRGIRKKGSGDVISAVCVQRDR